MKCGFCQRDKIIAGITPVADSRPTPRRIARALFVEMFIWVLLLGIVGALNEYVFLFDRQYSMMLGVTVGAVVSPIIRRLP